MDDTLESRDSSEPWLKLSPFLRQLVHKWAHRASAYRHDLDPEDFSQEILLNLWKTYYSHHATPNRSQIATLARHAMINLLTVTDSMAGGHHARSFHWPEMSADYLFKYYPDRQDSPESHLQKLERLHAVSQALSYREKTIVIALLNGLTELSIAHSLNLVESRISQIKSSVLHKLERLR